jgi:hypothetical protein
LLISVNSFLKNNLDFAGYNLNVKTIYVAILRISGQFSNKFRYLFFDIGSSGT